MKIRYENRYRLSHIEVTGPLCHRKENKNVATVENFLTSMSRKKNWLPWQHPGMEKWHQLDQP